MKKLFVLSILLILWSCTQRINFEQEKTNIEWNKKILNYKGKPFSGILSMNFPNGQLEGEFQYLEGELDGSYKTYYDNGQLKEISQWKKGERDGVLERFNLNGTTTVKVKFSKGVLEGPIINYFDEQEYFLKKVVGVKGTTSNIRYTKKIIGEMEISTYGGGSTEYSVEEGEILYYKGAVFSGILIYNWNNGRVKKVHYLEGKRDGPYEDIRADKDNYEIGYYKEGKLDGLYQKMERGYLKESYYNRGIIDSIKTYYNTGELFRREVIKGDIISEKEEFYINGQIKWTTNKLEGFKNLEMREYYYENGKLKEKEYRVGRFEIKNIQELKDLLFIDYITQEEYLAYKKEIF